MRRRIRYAVILPLVLAGALAGVGRGAAQSAQMLDAYFLEVETDILTETVVVPAAQISQRCADGDGCTLRIVADRDQQVARHDGRFFVVEGTRWQVTTPQNALGAPSYLTGDISTPSGTVIFLVGGFSHCRFIESASLERYEFVADAGLPGFDPPVHCLLRIDD